jgi:hypothetical protein
MRREGLGTGISNNHKERNTTKETKRSNEEKRKTLMK